jgi:hypothetical protein
MELTRIENFTYAQSAPVYLFNDCVKSTKSDPMKHKNALVKWMLTKR